MDSTNVKNDSVTNNKDSLVINIFLVYSPLQYLAAEIIATQFGKGAHNLLYYLKPEFREIVNQSRWHSTDCIPWPRFYPDKGPFGRMQRTKRNLEIVGQACRGADEIRLHAPVIDTEAVNFFINYLQTLYPLALFSVRITPDGLLNIHRHPLGVFKVALQHLKKLRRILYPALNYYTFSGDRTGTDAAIVDRIYVLQGIPHEYDESKCVTISLINSDGEENRVAATNYCQKRALVIGQPLTAYSRLTKRELEVVTEGIRTFIDKCDIADIEYKSHPRDNNHELGHPDYRELRLNRPLESYLADTHVDLVIGVFSAALVTARLILPRSCRVVAYGMDQIRYRSNKEKITLQATFSSVGVEMIAHSKH